MSDNKKYYYLKLVDNFYERDEMIMLESMPDGYMYSNILLKLYLRSLKNEGKLLFNDRIPYNSTMLSNITRFPVAVVEKSLNLFRELGLIEVLDNGAIYMLDIQNFIGESSTEADRKRAYRNKINEEKNLIKSQNLLGQMSDECPINVPNNKENGQMSRENRTNVPNGQMSGQTSDKYPPEIEIDIDIDIEKEIDIHTEKEDVGKYVNISKKNLKEFSTLYEKNIGVINGIVAEWLIEMSEVIDVKLFKRSIEIATDRGMCNPGYVKGIIKQWRDSNITTYEQLEAYQLQKKSQKEVKSDVGRGSESFETKTGEDARKSKYGQSDDEIRPPSAELLEEARRMQRERARRKLQV